MSLPGPAGPDAPGAINGFAKIPHAMHADPSLSDADLRVYCAVLRFAMHRGLTDAADCQIGAVCGKGLKSVSRALASLERLGYIARVKTKGRRFIQVLDPRSQAAAAPNPPGESTPNPVEPTPNPPGESDPSKVHPPVKFDRREVHPPVKFDRRKGQKGCIHQSNLTHSKEEENSKENKLNARRGHSLIKSSTQAPDGGRGLDGSEANLQAKADGPNTPLEGTEAEGKVPSEGGPLRAKALESAPPCADAPPPPVEARYILPAGLVRTRDDQRLRAQQIANALFPLQAPGWTSDIDDEAFRVEREGFPDGYAWVIEALMSAFMTYSGAEKGGPAAVEFRYIVGILNAWKTDGESSNEKAAREAREKVEAERAAAEAGEGGDDPTPAPAAPVGPPQSPAKASEPPGRENLRPKTGRASRAKPGQPTATPSAPVPVPPGPSWSLPVPKGLFRSLPAPRQSCRPRRELELIHGAMR